MNLSDCTIPSTEVKDYFITVSDGMKLYIVDFIPKKDNASKPIIFFVAGWISRIAGWKDVMRTLTDEYRVLYFESREKVSSVIPPGKKYKDISFDLERLVLDLHEVIQAVVPAKRNFVIAGSSLGSNTILEYLSMRTRQPDCALLITPLPQLKFPPILGDIIHLIPPSAYTAIKEFIIWYLRTFRLDPVKEKEQLEKYTITVNSADPYKLKPNALSLKKYSIWNKLPYIHTPCYIFGARTDKLHDTGDVKRLLHSLKNAEYIECESNKETHSEVVAIHFKKILAKKKYFKK